jgi:hypothetical protein
MKPYPKISPNRGHAPAVTFGDVLLRLCHRLMSRPSRPEPVAVIGKRPVPPSLQNLHHRLLDKSIQHRWDGQHELHLSPVRFWDGLKSVILFTRCAASASKCSKNDV